MPPTMPRARRASVSRCRIEQMTARRELAELQRLPRAGNDWRLLQDIASVALACDRRDLQLHSAQALIVRDYLEQVRPPLARTMAQCADHEPCWC